MTRLLRPFWSILLILLFTNVFASEQGKKVSNDSLILSLVKSGDLEYFKESISGNIDINDRFGNRKRTLLTYAIERRQFEIAEYLINKGVNLEQQDGTKTPLMFAARYCKAEFTELLLENGADINSINRDRNTAFHYAAKYNNFEVLKLLYKNGAKINIPNNEQWTALDYSIINGKPEIRHYLDSVGCILFDKKLPDYFDGPYISHIDDSILKIDYLVNKKGKKGSSMLSKEITSPGQIEIKGLKKDKKEYRIVSEPVIPASTYDIPSRIFVMGDIHGQYQRMLDMLTTGGVIDKNTNWTYGNGHLVFVGDISDRGEGVMEAYWLIYKLEQEAEISGGKVHLLLGNHEAMILKNDIRYIANKYYGLTSNLELEYHELFSENTIIGKWLRTKNVAEIIGNTMFIHAGISPELANKEMSIEEINNSFRHFLCTPDMSEYSDMDRFIISSLGPVWYRGYIKESGNYDEIDQQDLESVLKRYNAEQVVVGHTEVDLINPIKKAMVYPVNIPLADKGIIGQALLIKDGNFYRLDTDKTITNINIQAKN